MEELIRSTKVEALPIGLWPKLFDSIDQSRSSANWPLAKALQRFS